MSTINTDKELAAAPRPICFITVVFPDTTVLRVSSLSVTFGGNAYDARISDQQLDRLALLSEQGIDRIPSVTITMADPSGSLFTTYEVGHGFKGAKLTMQMATYDMLAGTFSTDNLTPFVGECDMAASDDTSLTVTANSILNLSRFILPNVPIQPRCPWANPITVAQRAEAGAATSYKDSLFYLCGETRSLAAAPPCEYTPQTCTQPNRYGGSTWSPKQSDVGINYISGGKWSWSNPDTSGKYKEFWPTWLGGAAWVNCVVLQQWGDGNYTRGEAAVGFGAVNIQRVIVNGVELSQGGKDYFWGYTNNGSRDSTVNLDAEPASSGPGNPYGNLTVVEYRAPKAVISPESAASVQVLGEKLISGHPSMQSSISITSSSADQGPIVIQFGRTLAGITDPYDGAPITITGSTWNGKGGTSGIPVNGTFIMRLLELPYDHATLQGTWAWGDGGAATLFYNQTNVSGGGPTSAVIAEALSWCGIKTAGLNGTQFTAAAAICNSSITYTDGAGNSQSQPRFSSAVAVRQRRSVGEIVRGLRQSIGAGLLVDSAGLVGIKVEGPLGEQQPSIPDGSNDSTGTTSTLRNGTTTTGYYAYIFNDSNAEKFKRYPQPLAQMPNRVTFNFQDPGQGYAISTFSLVDPDDVARIGYEIPGGLQVNPEGIATYNFANRCAKLGLAKILRGNQALDTKGTEYWEWRTSFRACKLHIGDIVAINSTKYGLTNYAIRVTEIRPDKDFQTMTIKGHGHSDQFYLDSHGNTPDVGYAPGLNNGLGVTVKPTFAVEVSALDSTVVEVTGLTFTSPTNTYSITSGTWSFYYVDPTAPLTTLTAPVLSTDTAMHVTDASHIADGDYIQLIKEIVLCGTPSGGTVPISRTQLGSLAASSVPGGNNIWKAQVVAQNVSFPLDFVNNSAIDTWELDLAIPDMLLLSVAATASNAYGTSPPGYVCLTPSSDNGLQLTAGGGATAGYTIINPPANTDYTITTTGNVVVNVVATTRNCTITLPLESSDVGSNIIIKLSPGSTFDAIRHLPGTDDVDGSTADFHISPGPNNLWSGLGV